MCKIETSNTDHWHMGLRWNHTHGTLYIIIGLTLLVCNLSGEGLNYAFHCVVWGALGFGIPQYLISGLINV